MSLGKNDGPLPSPWRLAALLALEAAAEASVKAQDDCSLVHCACGRKAIRALIEEVKRA